MTYEDAASALVNAGLLDQSDADTAIAVLASAPGELTYPDWTRALTQARRLDQADASAATAALEQAGAAEAKADPAAYEKGLENAGIF